MIDAAVKTGHDWSEGAGQALRGLHGVGQRHGARRRPADPRQDRPRSCYAARGGGSPAAQRAAQVIHKLATSPAADPSLSTADEEIGRHAFQTANGGFMLNWPYVYAAMQLDVKASCSAYP